MGAASDAAGIEPVIGEDALCKISGFVHWADGEHRPRAIQFAKAFPPWDEGDVYRSGHRLFAGRGGGSHVHNLISGGGKICHRDEHAIAHVSGFA